MRCFFDVFEDPNAAGGMDKRKYAVLYLLFPAVGAVIGAATLLWNMLVGAKLSGSLLLQQF